MWPAIWKFVASSPMWLVATSTFGSRDCDIGKWAITCYNLEWFTSKRWSLTRKNIKGEPNFARSTPTKPICTKHQTSSRPCIKPESTDGWKCRMRVDWNPGFTEWILRKKNIVMPSKWILILFLAICLVWFVDSILPIGRDSDSYIGWS